MMIKSCTGDIRAFLFWLLRQKAVILFTPQQRAKVYGFISLLYPRNSILYFSFFSFIRYLFDTNECFFA